MPSVIGMDPGNHGAIALISEYPGPLYVYSFQTLAALKGRGEEIDGYALADQFKVFFGGANHAFLEQVGAMPKDGGSQAFKFGTGFGILKGMLYAFGIPFTTVSPTVWQGVMMGIGSKEASKDRARARATQLFPEHANLFRGKQEGGIVTKAAAEGNADATLIAVYGFCKLTGRKI